MTNINSNNYKILQNTWNSPYCTKQNIENFKISYAVRGPMVNPEIGGRGGIARLGPISGPVSEPSPLNVEWRKQFSQNLSKNLFGIL